MQRLHQRLSVFTTGTKERDMQWPTVTVAMLRVASVLVDTRKELFQDLEIWFCFLNNSAFANSKRLLMNTVCLALESFQIPNVLKDALKYILDLILICYYCSKEDLLLVLKHKSVLKVSIRNSKAWKIILSYIKQIFLFQSSQFENLNKYVIFNPLKP